ncbi:MAG: fumarate hydratase [Lentisphaerae bacterium]|jgi:tartrate/fumarate subfamily iron-sulfur-dependent hydro-lyase beta chain|nr:fumarate hydratase [Lentisphaerota bacterium]MBT4814718.1 fumarate hydratase [Lentisphaerota bacterium]MBT5605800.1 fumarate hydratase [Lentisphaerota bacterium]MBT7055827.1 fumarate hydratase [Lentisphaerota bacterium]MBT7847488.1 fumarate hydratase [Lentisphaerota bacterium]
MKRAIRNLRLPLAPEQARELELGQLVTVSGPLFTGRSLFHIRTIENSVQPPLDYSAINCFFHVGPVMAREDDQWRVVSAEPTSSIRFERYGPAVVRKFGLRTLIGKTTMGPGTVRALQDVGGVFLSKIGLCGNQLASQVTRVVDVHFLDELGKTEATWVLQVENFGPFFVAIDAHGGSYFEQLDEKTAGRLPEVEEALGISPDFTFTEVNAPRRNEGSPA